MDYHQKNTTLHMNTAILQALVTKSEFLRDCLERPNGSFIQHMIDQ